MATELSVSEARAKLPEVIDRVQAGDEVTITRHGKAVAVVVRPDRLRSRRLEDLDATVEYLEGLFAKAARRPLDEIPGISEERAEELVRFVRAGRDGRPQEW